MRRTSTPDLNKINVGKLLTPSSVVMTGASSRSTFMTETPCWTFSCSNIGDSALQGPHQDAHTSTRTGTSPLSLINRRNDVSSA